MQRKKITFHSMLIMIGLIPAIFTAISLCFVSVLKIGNSLEQSTYEQLKVAAEGLDWYYLWDMRNNGEVTYEHDYVDNLENQNIELTLFMGDTRYITSIKDVETGERIEGTTADPKITEQVMGGNDYHAKNVMIGGTPFYVYYTPMVDDNDNVIGMAFAGEPVSVVNQAITSAILSMVIITIVLIVIFGIVIIVIASKIKKSIKEVSLKTTELSQGKLNVDITAKSSIEEIHRIIESARCLKDNLHTSITDINLNTSNINKNCDEIASSLTTCNNAADDIAASVDELARGTITMTESVQNCTNSIEYIGNEITEITSLSIHANDNATEVRTVSDNAKHQLEQLMDANANTIRVSQNVVSGISEANASAERIKTAAEVIANIASETNLLALNASIEAARAGEAGAGFAVVASSIQSLANQSDASAQEIQNIIHDIISISENNVSLANNIKNAVDNEGNVLTHVNDSFDVVNNKIEVVADAISTITTKTDSLNHQKDTVLDEINTLSAISEENAASCEETNASMEELKANVECIHQQSMDTKEMTNKLTESVKQFKL